MRFRKFGRFGKFKTFEKFEKFGKFEKKTFVLCLLAGLFSGCATQQATYVPPSKALKTFAIDTRDFHSAADAFVQTILGKLAAGELRSGVSGKRAVMAIGNISNNTSNYLDTDQLVKKISIALNNSERFYTTSIQSSDLARQRQEMREYLAMTGKDSSNHTLPDYYILTGKIIENYRRIGRKREVTYIFQMSLIDQSGLHIWEGEKEIWPKQQSTPAVGW